MTEWMTPAMVEAEQALAEAELMVESSLAEVDKALAAIAAPDEPPPTDLDEDLEYSQLRQD